MTPSPEPAEPRRPDCCIRSEDRQFFSTERLEYWLDHVARRKSVRLLRRKRRRGSPDSNAVSGPCQSNARARLRENRHGRKNQATCPIPEEKFLLKKVGLPVGVS